MTLPYPPDRLGRQPILSDSGAAAMRYMRMHPVLVECGPAKQPRQYVFSIRANINLGWVAEEDVPCCLAQKDGCCGQKKEGIVIYATEADLRQWTVGGGR